MGSSAGTTSNGIGIDKLQISTKDIAYPFNQLLQCHNDFKKTVYEPFQVSLVQDQQQYILVKSNLSPYLNNLSEIIKVQKKYEAFDNPFCILIHFIDAPFIENTTTDFFLGPLQFRKTISFYQDYLELSLYDKLLKGPLNKDELWMFIDCISQCMFQMQEKQIFWGGYQVEYIYEVRTPFGSKVFKIDDFSIENKQYSYYQSWLRQYQKTSQIDTTSLFNVRPTKSTLQAIKQKNKYPDFDFYKQDVFSMGILLLQCNSGLDIIKCLYDNIELTIDETIISLLINNIPEDYRKIVSKMLDLDDDTRYDWIQLKSYLDEEFSDKRILNFYTVDEFIYGYEYTHEKELVKLVNPTFVIDFENEKSSQKSDKDSHKQSNDFCLESQIIQINSDLLNTTLGKQNNILKTYDHEARIKKQTKRLKNDDVLFESLKFKDKLQEINKMKIIQPISKLEEIIRKNT